MRKGIRYRFRMVRMRPAFLLFGGACCRGVREAAPYGIIRHLHLLSTRTAPEPPSDEGGGFAARRRRRERNKEDKILSPSLFAAQKSSPLVRGGQGPSQAACAASSPKGRAKGCTQPGVARFLSGIVEGFLIFLFSFPFICATIMVNICMYVNARPARRLPNRETSDTQEESPCPEPATRHR